MTKEEFIVYLQAAVNGDFQIYTNKDEHWEHLPDGEVVFVGEDENEVFNVNILKV